MKSNKRLGQIVQYVFFLLVGVGLIYYTFHDHDLAEVKEELMDARGDVIVWALAITLLNYSFRAWRWRLLIQSMQAQSPGQVQVTGLQCFTSMMTGYLVNNAVPRLGEVTRCGVLSRHTGLSFSGLFGTVVVERVTDVLCLGLLALITVAFQLDFFGPKLALLWEAKSHLLVYGLYLLPVVVVGLVLVGVYWRRLLRSRPAQWLNEKIGGFLRKLRNGLLSIWYMKTKGWFLLATLGIWGTYIFKTYVWFFALAGTSNLGWDAAFTSQVFGSLGRALPVQAGGAGPYHTLIAQSVAFYGTREVTGIALATLMHAFETLFIVVSGAISFLLGPVLRNQALTKSTAAAS